MKKLILILIAFSCLHAFAKQPQNTFVKISTNYGIVYVKLYNETPKHRDNFIKLVKGNVLDSTLFHRVIQSFMIQGGDPTSNKANPAEQLGSGNIGYTIPRNLCLHFSIKEEL